jgi:integrase
MHRKARVLASREVFDHWAADSLQSYIARLYLSAGLKASSRSGRRTYATRLPGRGASTEDVQLLLGHGSINDTMRYLDVDYAVPRAACAAVL